MIFSKHNPDMGDCHAFFCELSIYVVSNQNPDPIMMSQRMILYKKDRFSAEKEMEKGEKRITSYLLNEYRSDFGQKCNPTIKSGIISVFEQNIMLKQLIDAGEDFETRKGVFNLT